RLQSGAGSLQLIVATEPLGGDCRELVELGANVLLRVGCAHALGLDLQDRDLVEQFAPRERHDRTVCGRRRHASRDLTSFAIASKTVTQSPRVCCLKSFAVGYHGLSVRSSSQRQSESTSSGMNTGRASAPARWAMAVFGATTRSRCCITAAVSRNASGPASKSSPSVSTFISPGSVLICSAPKFFCNEIRRTPAICESGKYSRSAIDRVLSKSACGLPCHAIPILNPCAPMASFHRVTRSGS